MLGYETDLFYLLKQKLPLREKHKELQEENALRIKSKNKATKKESVGKVDYSSLLPFHDPRKSTFSKINNYESL